MYNLDESGFTTVQKPSTVVSSTEKKQKGAVTPAERGILVTMVATIGANGSFLPLSYVLPRARRNPAFLNRVTLGLKVQLFIVVGSTQKYSVNSIYPPL